MSTYLNNARHHAKEIERYHAQADATGYSRARHHDFALSGLLSRANRSKHGRDDAAVILAIIESLRPKMAVMKERQDDFGSPQ